MAALPEVFGRTTWPLYLMGLFFLILAGATVRGSGKIIRAIYFLDSSDWQTSKGTVISSTVQSYNVGTSIRSSQRFEPRVSYRYQVAGVTYTGNIISFDDESVSPREFWIAESVSHKYAVGKQVLVYFLPSDPAFCALEPLKKNYVALLFATLLTLVGIGFFIVAGREDFRLQNNTQRLTEKRKPIR